MTHLAHAALESMREVSHRNPPYEAVRGANTQIPWRVIVATRNRLIHGYLGIDHDTLWSIVQGDIPSLLAQLRELRQRTM